MSDTALPEGWYVDAQYRRIVGKFMADGLEYIEGKDDGFRVAKIIYVSYEYGCLCIDTRDESHAGINSEAPWTELMIPVEVLDKLKELGWWE